MIIQDDPEVEHPQLEIVRTSTRESIRAQLGVTGWMLLQKEMYMPHNMVLYHYLLCGLDHGEDKEATSRRCLRAAFSIMPMPQGMLYDPLTGNYYDDAQARHARGSMWNVRTMIRAGWNTEQMQKWIAWGQIQGQVVQGSA